MTKCRNPDCVKQRDANETQARTIKALWTRLSKSSKRNEVQQQIINARPKPKPITAAEIAEAYFKDTGE